MQVSDIDFEKGNGLVPAIVQDNKTGRVLMLGYMNKSAVEKTMAEKKVTFFSRSKNRLWTKGEVSGNYLKLKSISVDCDGDALLVKAKPNGPTCHTGDDTCWGEVNEKSSFFYQLENIIKDRRVNPQPDSYTNKIMARGLNKIAQKVGEEAVELVIEAKDQDDDLFINEAADLMFHFMILLNEKGHSLKDLEKTLKKRHKRKEKINKK